jgi:dihydrofolate reductase
MELRLIYARAANGVIGRDNALPWHLPEDLAHFKRTTLGAPVLMGRKTWDSLPPKFRPLPGRRNLVITARTDWQAAGAERVASIEEARERCADAPVLWVIGGAQVYAAALPLADEVVVTEIDQAFEGDAYAPALSHEWTAVQREALQTPQGWRVEFVRYRRNAFPRIEG